MNDVLVKFKILEKENYSLSDKGEFCMCSIWLINAPIKYARCNMPKIVYDELSSEFGVEYSAIADYKFFAGKCTGIKVKELM